MEFCGKCGSRGFIEVDNANRLCDLCKGKYPLAAMLKECSKQLTDATIAGDSEQITYWQSELTQVQDQVKLVNG